MYYKIHPVKHIKEVIGIFNHINKKEKGLESGASSNLKKKLINRIEKLKKKENDHYQRKDKQEQREDDLNNKIDDIQDEINKYKELSSQINDQLKDLNYEIQDNDILFKMMTSSASPTPTPTDSPLE